MVHLLGVCRLCYRKEFIIHFLEQLVPAVCARVERIKDEEMKVHARSLSNVMHMLHKTVGNNTDWCVCWCVCVGVCVCVCVCGPAQDVNSSIVIQVLEALRRMLIVARPPNIAHETIDRQILAFVLRCLGSPFFNKRLRGLSDASALIETVQRATPDSSFGWLTPHALALWFREHNVVPALLGARVGGSTVKLTPHAEITARLYNLLKFMSSHGLLSQQLLDMLWQQVCMEGQTVCGCVLVHSETTLIGIASIRRHLKRTMPWLWRCTKHWARYALQGSTEGRGVGGEASDAWYCVVGPLRRRLLTD